MTGIDSPVDAVLAIVEFLASEYFVKPSKICVKLTRKAWCSKVSHSERDIYGQHKKLSLSYEKYAYRFPDIKNFRSLLEISLLL